MQPFSVAGIMAIADRAPLAEAFKPRDVGPHRMIRCMDGPALYFS